jgi:hypothetical protein
MFVIPVLEMPLQKITNINIMQIWMFLERNGTHAIEIDSLEGATSFAKENGFDVLGAPVIRGDIVFLLIDPKCKELNSFYTWGEIAHNQMPMKEVWRPFLWVKAAEDLWGTNQYLNDIMLTGDRSVYNVVSALF